MRCSSRCNILKVCKRGAAESPMLPPTFARRALWWDRPRNWHAAIHAHAAIWANSKNSARYIAAATFKSRDACGQPLRLFQCVLPRDFVLMWPSRRRRRAVPPAGQRRCWRVKGELPVERSVSQRSTARRGLRSSHRTVPCFFARYRLMANGGSRSIVARARSGSKPGAPACAWPASAGHSRDARIFSP